jgi:hypothetical protein
MPLITPPTTIPHLGDLQPWQTATHYYVGQRVTNNSRVYQCTAEGTSDVPPGPTTTGGAIVDGTVVWAYQAEIADAWAAGVSYAAGDVVTNDGGKLYVAQNAGVSDLYGSGPTGTDGAIVDGSMVWAYTADANAQITQPTSRMGDIGLVPGAPLFAQYPNWWFSKVIEWLYVLRGIAQLYITWLYGAVFKERHPSADPDPNTDLVQFQAHDGTVRSAIDHGVPVPAPFRWRSD